MKQYLLSIYQPDGDPPAPEVLEPIMRDINAVDQAMRAAGAPPSHRCSSCRTTR